MKKRTGTYPLRLPASLTTLVSERPPSFSPRAAPKPISKQHAAFCEGTAVNRRNPKTVERRPLYNPINLAS